MSYSDKLKDPRWLSKRSGLIQKELCLCNDCGDFFQGGRGLEAHHCWYEFGKEPWDYPDDCFLVLCRKCHKERQKVQNSLMVVLGQYSRLLSVEEMKALTFELVFKRTELEQPLEFKL